MLWQDAMRDGDFAAAWRISDSVLAGRAQSERDDPRLPYHLRWVWDGRDLDGRSVLVRCYHGLGDTLQFCRYLPELGRQARRLTVEAPPALVPLLATLPGPSRLVPFRPARPLPPAECDIEIMELAHALRVPPEPAPYLPIARTPPNSGRLQVGLCWQATATWQPERSVPPALLAPLLDVPGLAVSSLQRGATLPGLAEDCPASILQTARRIAGLDVVLTVDTMIAHLAGALGVPVWLLLMHEPDWRWLAGGRGSVWYGNVRKYAQTEPGAWSGPVTAAIADLTRAAAAGTLRT